MSEKCPCCGNEVERADAQCPHCGTMPVRDKDPAGEANVCAACGGKLEAGQKFCPGCGAQVAGRKEEEPPVQAAEKGSDAQNYDEAVRIGKEVDNLAGGAIDLAGGWINPMFGGIPLVMAGFLCHEVLWFVLAASIFGLASMCCRAVVKQRLEAHDVEGAKSALGPAKTCFWIAAAALGAGLLDVVIRLMALANK